MSHRKGLRKAGSCSGIVLFILLAISRGAALPQATPGTSDRDTTKFVSFGRTQFLQTCSGCHGANADGADGPNLHHQALTEAFVIGRITKGVKDEMPAFTNLSQKQLASVTKYVISLQ